MLVVANDKIVNIVSTNEENEFVDENNNAYNLYDLKTEDVCYNDLIFWLYYNHTDRPHFIPNGENFFIQSINCKIKKEIVSFTIHLRYPSKIIGKGGKTFNWYKEMLAKSLKVPFEINLKETPNNFYIDNPFKKLQDKFI